MPYFRRSLFLVVTFVLVAFPADAKKRIVNGRIAFDTDRDGNFEIYTMQPDGSGITRLTNDRAEDRDPAWSPDGTRIAFVRDGRIHVMNADGSGITKISNECCGDGGPAWSPDGRRIAFHSIRDADNSGVTFEIYSMGADGSEVIRLTDLPGSHFSPAFSPDGRTIAFTCTDLQRDFTRHICTMNADGSNVTQRTNDGDHRDDDPSFSPDGTKVLFTQTGHGYDQKAEVMIMNVNGSNIESLYNGFYVNAQHPVFSPDGKRITFTTGPEHEEHRVRVMDANGDNDEILTDNNFDNRNPHWQRRFVPDTIGLYIPSLGRWFLRSSNTAGNPDLIVQFGGLPGDLPVAGDWNGDGRTDLAVYREGVFVRMLLNSFTLCASCQMFTEPEPFDTIAFGEPGDLPVAGDWDGDGKDDVGVFRPGKQGTFLLRVPQLVCPFCFPPRFEITTRTIFFGTSGLPVAGDWDGDGKDGIGLYEPNSATFFLSDDLAKPNFTFVFGASGNRPLAGDWSGIGRDGIGVFDPPITTMALANNLNAAPNFVFVFGIPEGLPVAGKWR